MTTPFNQAPYFDDFNEDKGFYKILFKPSTAVQTRELNQFQTILQNQIARFGQNVFKDGSVVVNGNTTFNNNYTYVTLNSSYNSVQISTFIANLVGELVVGQTTGVIAQVVNYSGNQLFIQYQSGANGASNTFADGEIIAPQNTALSGYTVQAIPSGATGAGSAFSVARGIYFVNNQFAVVEPQTIIIDPTSTTPSATVGFTVTESIITAAEDNSLYDNAQGSPNFSAPGADRYQITLTLTSVASGGTVPADFTQIATITNGALVVPLNQTSYNIIADMLAQRTYDQAGDFTVTPFGMNVKEYRNNNRGTWAATTVYLAGDVVNGNYVALNNGTSGSTAPTATSGIVSDGSVVWLYKANPYFNKGVNTASNTDTLNTALANSSNLVAVMGSGKSYVKGYQLTKIAPTNVTVPKPRTTVQTGTTTINPEYDNYIVITGLNSMVDFTQLPLVTLYDQINVTPGTVNGTAVGTARILNVSSLGGGNYRCSLGDIKLNAGINFNRTVKQVGVNLGTTYFTASIVPVLTQLTGSVSAATSTAVTGTGTLFLTELTAGDYIDIGGTLYQIQSIATNNSLTLTTAATATGVVSYLATTTLVNSSANTLVVPLSNTMVASVRDQYNNIVTQYTVTEAFTATSNGSNTFSITVKNATTDTFTPTTNSENYLVVDTTSNTIETPVSLTLNSTSQQLTVVVANASHNYSVYAAVNRVGTGTEKTKTIAQQVDTFASPTATTYLSKADGYVLASVMMDSGSFATPSGTYSIDITDRYTFDNGQKNSHYGPCSITLNNGATAPVAPIQVTYVYFNHSVSGDYFTVNSYIGTIDYAFIPSFNGVCLGDAIDFRSRVDTYNGTPSVVNGFPSVGYDLFTSYSYYVGRKDIITIDTVGTFADLRGVAAINPTVPSLPNNTVALYNLTLGAYTKSITSSSVSHTEVDNKVYTMADIGDLDKRITNLEYYTSLSLLEQNTLSTPLTDSSGLSLYKNGIAVDSFNGVNTIANTASPDYFASFDVTNGILRPYYTMRSIGMVEKNISDAERTTSGYVRKGNLITLPFSEIKYIEQSFGTEYLNVNPFAVYKFVGSCTLNPPSDNWFDVSYIPAQVTQVIDDYSTMNYVLQAQGVLGTHWGAWQTTWSGITSSTNMGDYYVGKNSNADATYFSKATNDNPNSPQYVTLTGSTASNIFNNYYSPGSYLPYGIHGTFNLSYDVTATNKIRTGTNTSLVPNTVTSVNGTKMIAQTAIPYIRQRYVQYTMTGLKPNTQYNTYFDNTNITADTHPATRMVFTGITGQSSTFNTTTDIGAAANTITARALDDGITVLSVGDVITGATSGATAVVVAQEYSPTTSENVLYVLNIIGSFSANEVINGSISGASVTYLSSTTPSICTATDNGTAHGMFLIENSSVLSFQCGTKNVVFSDNSASSNLGLADTYAFTQYEASGVLNIEQQTLTATTTGTLVTTNVSESQTLYSGSVNATFLTYYDPLAQSFIASNANGMFITGVDIFLQSKDATASITLDIIDMNNGQPSTTIIPNSSVTMFPNDITVSADGSVATRFEFVSPVYLNGGTQYAIRLMSNSNNYNVFIATLGQQDLITGLFVTQQPYAGVLFESKNATTWVPNNQSVLKFNLYQAQFSTNASTFDLVNMYPDATPLAVNPFTSTVGSDSVGVVFVSHGLSDGSTVTLSGAASGNGIPALNGTFVVSNCTLDTFTITGAATATFAGTFGGSTVVGRGNNQFDVMMPDIQELNFANTSTSYAAKFTTGKSVDGTETPYQLGTSYLPVTNGSNFYLDAPALVSSQSSASSLYLQCTLTTSDPNVSPVIDMSRASCTLVQNKINSQALTTEVNSVGSANLSKYVTKTIQLANPASNIHIMFGYSMFSMNNIDVYYKSALSASGTSINDQEWVLMTPDSALVANSNASFTDASYTLMDISSFDSMQLKIVMRSTNESLVPTITALRVILTS